MEQLGVRNLLLDGKSMGGRIVTLVCPGTCCIVQPSPNSATSSTRAIPQMPTLVVRGERKPFSGRSDVAAYKLSKAIQLHWLADGDHRFQPRKASAGRSRRRQARAITAL